MTVALGHIGINVMDLDRSKTFYRELLQLEVIRESDRPGKRYVYLGRDGTAIVTLWEQSLTRFTSNSAGLHHVAFLLADVEQVRSAEARAKVLGAVQIYGGIVPHAEGSHSGGFYVEDPDGSRIEVFAPTGVDGTAPVSGERSCGFFFDSLES